jgi:hypothetical protein
MDKAMVRSKLLEAYTKGELVLCDQGIFFGRGFANNTHTEMDKLLGLSVHEVYYSKEFNAIALELAEEIRNSPLMKALY